jgi:hypothetical protein
MASSDDDYQSAYEDSDDEFFTVDVGGTGFGTQCLDVDGTRAARRLTDAQMRMVTRINSVRGEGYVQRTLGLLARHQLDCSICLKTILVGSQGMLPCGDVFHFVCIDAEMQRRRACPLCRRPVPVAPRGALARIALRF